MNMSPFVHGSSTHTDVMKTQGLKQALDKYGFDVAFGGARRDEEKSRAKERIFSFRNENHHWNPKVRGLNYGMFTIQERIKANQSEFSVVKLTELDIWQYIHPEKIPIVSTLLLCT